MRPISVYRAALSWACESDPEAIRLADIGLFSLSLILCLLVVAWVGYSRCICPWVEHDTVEHLHTVWLMRQGLRPYKDFFCHHMPMFYFVLGQFARGESAPELVISARRWTGALVFLHALLWAAGFRLWTRASSWSALWVFALLLGFPTLMSWSVHADSWNLLPLTGGVLVWLWVVHEQPDRRLEFALGSACGLLLGIAMSIQPKNPGAVVGAVLVTVYLRRWILLGGMALGGVIAAACNLWLVLSWGVWPQALEWIWGMGAVLSELKPKLRLIALVRHMAVKPVLLGIAALADRRWRLAFPLWLLCHLIFPWPTWSNAASGLYLALTAAGLASLIDALKRALPNQIPVIAVAVAAFFFFRVDRSSLVWDFAWPFVRSGRSTRVSIHELAWIDAKVRGGTVLALAPRHPITARDTCPYLWHGAIEWYVVKPAEGSRELRRFTQVLKRLGAASNWTGKLPDFVWTYDPLSKPGGRHWLKRLIDVGLLRGISWQELERILRREYRPVLIFEGVGYLRRSKSPG